MAAKAVGAGAVGSAKTPLQLAGTPEFKALVREAAQLHNTTISTLLRRALLLYIPLADGIPAELAKAIESSARRQDERRSFSSPVLRDGVSDLLAKGSTQLELDLASVTAPQAGEA